MGILATIKDKVKDQFGIFDDVQDYADFAEKQSREFERKANLAKKVVDRLEREIVSTRDLNDLKTDPEIKQLKAVLRDIRNDMDEMVRATGKVASKLDKDRDIKQAVGNSLREIENAQVQFMKRLREAEASLGVLEDEQKAVFRELDEGDDPEAQRKLAIKAGRVTGAVAAVLGLASLIARVTKVI